MTLLPTHSRDVQGVEGKPYKLNQMCPVDACPNTATERHHLYRKSFLIGDYWWVNLPDRSVRGNCIGLCNGCHFKVTVNKVRIVYMDQLWWWAPPEGDISRLTWQPPTLEEAVEMPVRTYDVIEGVLQPDTMVETVDSSEVVCETCHQKIKPPKPQTSPEAKKNRRTYAVAVPKDDQEDGASVLEALIDAARDELAKVGLNYGTERKYAFHVLTTSLALFVQHAGQILADS